MTTVPRRCPTCGQELAGARTFSGLCAACLLRLAQGAAFPSDVEAAPACRVLSVLGAGVRSISYLAERTGDSGSRLAVLKIFLPAIADGGDAITPRRDALLQLRHHGVATTRQVGVTEMARAFLVRDFVAGVSLPSFLQRPQPGGSRAGLIDDIREAVAALHAAGLAHGRLTATNVVVVHGPSRPAAILVDAGAVFLDPVTARDAPLPAVEDDEAAVERLAASLLPEPA